MLSCNDALSSPGDFSPNTVKIGKNPTRRIRNLPNTNRGRTCSPTAYKGGNLVAKDAGLFERKLVQFGDSISIIPRSAVLTDSVPAVHTVY